jgi:hypothetical protein
MTSTGLWLRLWDFIFGSSGSALDLTFRLARDNGWAWHYTGQMMGEYPHFLCMAAYSGEEAKGWGLACWGFVLAVLLMVVISIAKSIVRMPSVERRSREQDSSSGFRGGYSSSSFIGSDSSSGFGGGYSSSGFGEGDSSSGLGGGDSSSGFGGGDSSSGFGGGDSSSGFGGGDSSSDGGGGGCGGGSD